MADVVDEESQGGRIFFSSAGRSLEEEDEIELTSVGVDIGSSTSHLVFSRIKLEARDSRYVVISREVLHESDILLTPYKDGENIDSDVLGAFIAKQYATANIKPEVIDTGALILTGVAVRRRNARAIGELFAAQTGKFVAVSAGDNLETTMAAYGSGAAANSERIGGVMNVDIGGGTSKIAVCEGGKVVDLTAIDIGARLVAFDEEGRISRIEEAGKRFAAEVGITLALGEALSVEQRQAMAARMAERLFEVMKLGKLSKETAGLLRLDPMTYRGIIQAVTFSGGVSEFVYGYETASFGDLGPYLAAEIRKRVESWGPKLMEPVEGIRATVIGASQYTIQVSGSTIFVAPQDILPQRNVPVIAPVLPLGEDEEVDPAVIAKAIEAALRRLDLLESDRPVALCFRWQGSATFKRLNDFCKGALAGFKSLIDAGHPLVLVSEGDVGGLLGIHCKEELKVSTPVISIDGVELKEFDYIDIGAMLPASGAVPVVIKSLIFPSSTAVGRDFETEKV
jgi:ethanolamine utilization protein EutA